MGMKEMLMADFKFHILQAKGVLGIARGIVKRKKSVTLQKFIPWDSNPRVRVHCNLSAAP